MKTLTSAMAALVTAISIGLPSQLLAEELDPPGSGDARYGDFVSAIAPGKLGSYFDNPKSLRIVGARVLVQGLKDGRAVVKVIEYTEEDSLTVPPLKAKVRASEQARQSAAPMSALFFPLPSPEDCTRPVLAIGQESNYNLEWCEHAAHTSAKKNYFYNYSNGNYQLVATLIYTCADDEPEMPTAVSDAVCQ